MISLIKQSRQQCQSHDENEVSPLYNSTALLLQYNAHLQCLLKEPSIKIWYFYNGKYKE